MERLDSTREKSGAMCSRTEFGPHIEEVVMSNALRDYLQELDPAGAVAIIWSRAGGKRPTCLIGEVRERGVAIRAGNFDR